MANIIVVSLADETKAIEALNKLKELDTYKDITLYEYMMFRKLEDDHFEVLNFQNDKIGWRVLTAMALGGILGSIAGPVGLIVGLYSGTAVGVAAEIRRFTFEENFINKVNNRMRIGTIAIVAEVGEDSTVFVDKMLPFGAQIIRTDADVEFDNYVDEQIEDLEDEIEDERERFKKATVDEKAKISAKIDELVAERKVKVAEMEVKRKSALIELKEKTKDRIDRLESRFEKYRDSAFGSIDHAKAERIKKRINRQQKRLAKLNESFDEIFS